MTEQIQQNESLAKLDQAEKLIAEVRTMDEAFALKALFQIAEIEARRIKSIDLEKQAVTYKLWTMDKIGQMLEETKKRGERASPKNTQFVHGTNNGASTVKTLSELKISPTMSSRYQKFHKMPEQEKINIINNAVRRIERREYIEKEKNASDIPKDWLVNKPLTWAERTQEFQKHFPKVPQFMRNCDGEYDGLYGMWKLGVASMKQGEYYGAHPPNYLERILACFTDCTTVIHLFAGTIRPDPPRVITFDINPETKPTICDDISNIKNHAEYFRKPNLLVMADPYYEDSDFERQKQKPINKKRVFDDLASLVPRGTFVSWLDVSSVVWSAEIWKEVGLIGVRVGSNTRYRAVQILERL